MELTLGILVLFQLARYLMNRERFRNLEEQIAAVSGGPDVQMQIRELTHRVYRLETRFESPFPAVAVERPQPPPLPQMPILEPEPEPEPESVMAPGEPDGPTLSERLRAAMGGEEWEALVGGSLLNKLGALVLVVGIALFLGFSFTQMAPAGRAVIAMAVSVAILGAGVWIERAAKYQVFARGLIGAGWAGLYATAYAIYALPAAKVIDDPFLGSLGVLLVAAGMIGHSLQYRSQALTAVAYFTAFAGLAATPSTPFAVVALIPLAVSLLYLAVRFDWHGMALFGIFATYGTCISRGSSDAPLFSTEGLFLIYWALFEGFDLLRTHRRITAPGLGWVSPLNALAFVGLSYSAWASKAPEQLWLMASCAAALYFASAMVRVMVRAEARSYEFSLTVSAVLAALAIVAHVPGVWIGVGLAIEAEILYVAGVRWNSLVLRSLGAIAFMFSLGRLFAYDYPAGGSSEVLGRSINNWTPPVLMHVLLFYANRALRGPNQIFSYAASALAALVIFKEIPNDHIGTALVIFAAVSFELGFRKRLSDFRIQAYLLGFAGTCCSVLDPHWGTLSIGLVLFYANALRCQWTAEGVMEALEFQWAQRAGALATAIFALLVLRNTAPPVYEGLAECLLAGVLFELALRKLPPQLRLPSYLVWSFGVWQVISAASPLALSYAIAAVVAWYFWWRTPGVERHAMGAAGTLLAMRAMWFGIPEPLAAVGWAYLGLVLIVASRLLRNADLTWQSYGVAAITFVYTLLNPPSIWFAAASVAAFYAAQALSERYGRTFFSIVATLLLTATLYDKVSGSILTVAWGGEGLALLAIGFVARERVLRLQGLVLFFVCILKLFLYDLRNLETMYRILSFIALGLILLGVSWIYTRFREHVRRYL